jgi:hypothetical protein
MAAAGASAGPSGAVGGAASGLARPAAVVLGLYVVSRLLVGAVTAAAPGPLTVDSFLRWDADYYLHIAGHGYPRDFPPEQLRGSDARSPLAFFPGYPLAVRAVAATGLSLDMAGLLVNLLAGAVAAVAVLVLARQLLTGDRALLAAALWVCWPGTSALSYVYSDGLFLAATTSSLLALGARRWILAGLLGAIATATRPSGLALLVAAAVAAVVAIRMGGAWRAVLAPALTATGALAWFSFLQLHTGDAAGWLGLQERGWGQRLDVGVGFGSAITSPSNLLTGIWLLYLMGFAFLAWSALALRRGARLSLPLSAFVIVVLAQCLLYSNVGPRPRLLAAAVPLFVLVSAASTRRTMVAVTAACAVLLAVVTWLHVRGVVAP